MGMPANLTVDPATNEVYVADGYGNRRVIVIDGDTFAFKRMWGAYGNRPDDADLGPYLYKGLGTPKPGANPPTTLVR
jgi:hypothetical protein